MSVADRLRRHLTLPTALSLVALTVALGGTSYAVAQLPRNSVGQVQLKSGAVTSPDVLDRSLRARDFARGQLPAGPPGPPGAPGAAGLPGSTGPAGTSAAAVVTGVAVLPPFNRAMSLDGRTVAVESAAVPHATDVLVPDEPTVIRNITVRMDPAPATGVGRTFYVLVDGEITRVCSFRGPATGCTQAADASIEVPPGALVHVGSLALIGENALLEGTLRWGMTIGAE